MPRQEPLTAQIARLKAVKQEAIAKKKECAKGLKAAQKKLKKVKSALGQLSDEDLNQAVADRRAVAARVAAAKAAAQPWSMMDAQAWLGTNWECTQPEQSSVSVRQPEDYSFSDAVKTETSVRNKKSRSVFWVQIRDAVM